MACQIMSMKNFNYTIWNRTRKRLVAQSEQTATVCSIVCDNADRLKYSAMSGNEVLNVTRLPQAYGNEP